MDTMDLHARVAELITAPKARWALAWLAAPATDEPRPVDFQDAATVRIRATRFFALRDNPAGLAAEIHTRVEDWRHQGDLHNRVASLGPADGYRRVATAVADAPAAAWWWRSAATQPQTWICTDPGIRDGRGLPFDINYAHHWDSTAPAVAIMTSSRLTGLPATALLSDQNKPPLLRDNPDILSAWAVSIKPDARVVDIHSPADWISLVDRYPSHRTDLLPAPHLRTSWPNEAQVLSIDWHRLSRDYDGVHLSFAGWLTATSQILTVPGRGLTVCDGWHTEATLWFKPAFTKLERLPADTLIYGYGRPVTGAQFDLTRTAIPPRRWWNLFTRPTTPA